VIQHAGRRLVDDAVPSAVGIQSGHDVTVQLLPTGSRDIPPETIRVMCRLLNGAVISVECGYYDLVLRLKEMLQVRFWWAGTLQGLKVRCCSCMCC
jgi:hypothetical protein